MKQQPPPDLPTYGSRLRHLHQIVSLIPKENFDLAYYGLNATKHCGAIGCALGWAARDPTFRAMGFVNGHSWLPVYETNGGFHTGIDAAKIFFGLGYEAYNIFHVGYYSPRTLQNSQGMFKEECLERIQGAYERADAKVHEKTGYN